MDHLLKKHLYDDITFYVKNKPVNVKEHIDHSYGTAINIPFPVDDVFSFYADSIRLTIPSIQYVDSENINVAIQLEEGKHKLSKGRYIFMVKSDDLVFISIESECTVDVRHDMIEISIKESDQKTTVGIKRRKTEIIISSNNTENIFNIVSAICSSVKDRSVFRSHPFFRDTPPGIAPGDRADNKIKIMKRCDMTIKIPCDLRYLYVISPLAYYLGSSIEQGDTPEIRVRGKCLHIESDLQTFQKYSADMLARMFYLDTSARCLNTCDLPGQADLERLTGKHVSKICSLNMADRLMLYAGIDGEDIEQAFPQWHMASYVDPSPESVRILPWIMDTFSAVYMPTSQPISEEDIARRSYREYMDMPGDVVLKSDGYNPDCDSIIFPGLHGSNSYYWYSNGFPVDAVKAYTKPGVNKYTGRPSGNYYTRVGVICNEPVMEGELQAIYDALAGTRSVIHAYRNVTIEGLAEVFSAGYDIVQFIGHCDCKGFKCEDGYAGASDIVENRSLMFFLNSCSSCVEAAKLMEKGSVCGVATLHAVQEEVAVDVCSNFYMMLGAGYPALTALNAARECSVVGKEYILMGDGSHTSFHYFDPVRPFYKILKSGDSYNLHCKLNSLHKGLIFRDSRGKAVPDTGLDMRGISAQELADTGSDLTGYCQCGGRIFRSVSEAVESMIYRTASTGRTRASGRKAVKVQEPATAYSLRKGSR